MLTNDNNEILNSIWKRMLTESLTIQNLIHLSFSVDI